jgi:hypothetical protein
VGEAHKKIVIQGSAECPICSRQLILQKFKFKTNDKEKIVGKIPPGFQRFVLSFKDEILSRA